MTVLTKPKPKKSRRKRLENQLDNIFSLYIRKRDKNICFTCGATLLTAIMQCGHLITRGRRAIRWDERGSVCQCSTCNLMHEHYPEIFTAKWISKYGEGAYQDLVLASWDDKKFSLQILEDMISHYKDKLESLEQKN